MKEYIDVPTGWGSDGITEFIELARQNEFATFANMPNEFGKLRDLEKQIRLLIDNLNNARPFHVGLFVLKAHSSLLAATRCAMSGHVVETWPLLRASLEAALYGLYLSGDEKRMVAWLQRNEDAKAKQIVRKTFSFGNLRRELDNRSQNLGLIAQKLYDECIDSGAHPNVGMIANLEIIDEEASLTWKLKYLHGIDDSLRAVLKATAQVSLLVLEVLCLIYPERVKILGITDRLPDLRAGL